MFSAIVNGVRHLAVYLYKACIPLKVYTFTVLSLLRFVCYLYISTRNAQRQYSFYAFITILETKRYTFESKVRQDRLNQDHADIFR